MALKLLPLLCAAFVLLGWTLPWGWDAGWMQPWHDALSAWLGAAPSPETRRLEALLFGILGGSIAGKWVAAGWIAEMLRRTRDRALWRLSWAGLLAWFALDSGVSAALGAGFNVTLVNLLPLVVVGGCLLAAGPGTVAPKTPPRARPDAVVSAILVFFAGTGLLFALGPRSLPLLLWNTAMESHLLAGVLTVEAERVQRLLGGAIGGTVFAHFVLLLGAHRAAPEAPWVRAAVATSIAAWVIPDALASIAHGAWYNLVYIDAPCVVGVAVAVALLRRRAVM